MRAAGRQLLIPRLPLTILLLSSHLIRRAEAVGCVGSANAACDCQNALVGGGVEMSCLRVNLTTVPPATPNVVSLDIRKNRIPAISDNTFATLIQLTYLDLSWNAIQMIEPAAFANLGKLAELRLNNNGIASLPDFAFKDLPALNTLVLRDNRLAELRSGTFYGLLNLRSLDLSGNQFAALADSAFIPLIRVEGLNLAGNLLTALPDNLLITTASLASLSLADNRIASLPQSGFFRNCPGLQTVDLSGNRIATKIPDDFFAGPTSLLSVDLSGAYVPCDCTQYVFRTWMNGASAAQAKIAWSSSPATSGTCSQPAALQGQYVISVSAGNFVCTTAATSTTAAATTTTSVTRAATTAAAASVATTGETSSAGGSTAKGASTATAAYLNPATAAGGDAKNETVQIALGSCAGALALSLAISLSVVFRRRCARQRGANDRSNAKSHAKKLSAGGGGFDGQAVSPPNGSRSDTFPPPPKPVRSSAPANGNVSNIASTPPSNAAPASSPATPNGLAKRYSGPASPPVRMNGLLTYAHAKRGREGNDAPDGAADGGSPFDKEPKSNGHAINGGAAGASSYFVYPQPPPQDAAYFDRRNGPRQLSLRDGRPLAPERNGPTSSSLRAARPAYPLPPPGGFAAAAAPHAGQAHDRRRLPLYPPSPFILVSSDLHPQVTVVPSQGSVDSGVHSLPAHADAGTPSTHRSFSPLSNDAIFMTEPPSRPPLLEPRRYKNDTFV